MQYVNHVDSEGGPLLLADAAVAQKWQGTKGDEADFRRACETTDENDGLNAIDIGSESGVIWDMGGPGTTDVFLDAAGNLLLIRTWLEDTGDADSDEALHDAVCLLAELPWSATESWSVELTVVSGIFTVLWSVESGECIESLDFPSEWARPSIDSMMTESCGLLLHLKNGRYTCFTDEVESSNGQARRCRITFTEP